MAMASSMRLISLRCCQRGACARKACDGFVAHVASKSISPARTVITGFARTFQPSNGQLRDFDWNASARIVHEFSGSMSVRSATPPTVSVPIPSTRDASPQSRAGASVSIDRAIGDREFQFIDIPLRTKRRVHLRAGVVAIASVAGEEQMVRRCFARDAMGAIRTNTRTRFSQDARTSAAREMLRVIARIDACVESQIALEHDFFSIARPWQKTKPRCNWSLIDEPAF